MKNAGGASWRSALVLPNGASASSSSAFFSSSALSVTIALARAGRPEAVPQNVTLWYACPWTLSVASVQAGGLGMVALGLAQLTAARTAPTRFGNTGSAALWLCVVGLIGVFLVGYPGYFVFDKLFGRAFITRRSSLERTRGYWGGRLHWDLFRRRCTDVQHSATLAQCYPCHNLMSGAFRGVSEEIMNFARQSGRIDWARLREARF